MIKLNGKFRKSKLSKGSKEDLLLLSFRGEKPKSKESRVHKKNLAFALDVSGSMSSSINGYGGHRFFNRSQLIGAGSMPQERVISKLELAKKAIIKAVQEMNDGDIVSLVTFHSQTDLLIEPTVISEKTRGGIIDVVNRISTSGATDLHSGWLKASEAVAQNLNPEWINRVILLSDGEITVGINCNDRICSDVKSLSDSGITTSCFGVGKDFNEDLLRDVSLSGEANYYYIQSEGELAQMFSVEFDGLSNTVARGVKIKFESSIDGLVVTSKLNNLVKDGGQYVIPDIMSTTDVPLLFELNFGESIPSGLVAELVKVKVNYVDVDGKSSEHVFELSLDFVEASEWEKLEFNSDVEVQEKLLKIAEQKEMATQALNTGDISAAKDLLMDSMNLVGSMDASDSRVAKELSNIQASMAYADAGDTKTLRKTVQYQSYLTRSGKS